MSESGGNEDSDNRSPEDTSAAITHGGHNHGGQTHGDQTHGAGAAPPRLSGFLVFMMAVATGAIVANLYYAQPLLHEIALAFHTGSAAAAIVVTFTQIGYAGGLALVVPLGDIKPRKSLVARIYVLAALALVLCALAPDLWLLQVGSVAVGCASVAGQIMIPLAADLARPERRGRVVARMMTGLLLGILLARTVSGLVAQAAGWRAIYWLSAVLMVILAAVLYRLLPSESARPHLAYLDLVRSTFRTLVEEPLLRRRSFHGACAFAAFSVLWTSLAFLLAGRPYHYSNAVIGLFGLVGVAGVVAANLAGRLADSKRTTFTTITAGLLLAASFGLMVPGKTSLLALVIGIVALDLGTQGMQITNQAIIYTLRPEQRSRINSAYMLCYFVGGALGSVTSGFVMARFGWDGVCALGVAFSTLSLLTSATDLLRGASEAQRRRTRAPATS